MNERTRDRFIFSLLGVVMGLVVGGMGVYFYAKAAQPKIPQFSIPGVSFHFADNKKRQPRDSQPIDFPTAMKFKDQYLQQQPIPISYFDVDVSPNPIFDTLRGLAVDRKAIEAIMARHTDPTQDADRLYIMFGVRNESVTLKPGFPAVMQQSFTTVLIGVKDDPDTTHVNSYTYLDKVIFDYSNPCPPFCPPK